MKDLILFGAYDRFNFGDMLMPMAIRRYIERDQPQILDRYRLRFASLSRSDMSDRDCLPTEPILHVCAGAAEGSALIVTGGEVAGARRQGLFMHNSRSDAEHAEKRRLQRDEPVAFEARLVSELGPIWEYPYLPPRDCLPAGGRIMHNAIGGRITPSEGDARWARLAGADYISVRDARLPPVLEAHGIAATVAPCAVSLIADGTFRDLDSGPPPCEEPYFVFQCMNNPTDIPYDEMAEGLRTLCHASGLRAALVPLAYASNHDDHKALCAIAERLGDLAVLEATGTLSGILSAFRHAQFYIGTSLHGTIAAMAYAIPYFPFKRSIAKTGAYLESWSDSPALRQVRLPSQIADVPWADLEVLRGPLAANAQRLAQASRANLARIAHRL